METRLCDLVDGVYRISQICNLLVRSCIEVQNRHLHSHTPFCMILTIIFNLKLGYAVCMLALFFERAIAGC
jgi:hypothetical protein